MRVACSVLRLQSTNPFISNRLTNFNKRYLQSKYNPLYICVITLPKTKNPISYEPKEN